MGDGLIDGDTINSYFTLLSSVFPRICFFDTYFFPCIRTRFLPDRAKKLPKYCDTRIVDTGMTDRSQVCIPVWVRGNHWILLVVDTLAHLFVFYDPLSSKKDRVSSYYLELMKEASVLRTFFQVQTKIPSLKNVAWLVCWGSFDPPQNDSRNCAIYVCAAAEILAAGDPDSIPDEIEVTNIGRERRRILASVKRSTRLDEVDGGWIPCKTIVPHKTAFRRCFAVVDPFAIPARIRMVKSTNYRDWLIGSFLQSRENFGPPVAVTRKRHRAPDILDILARGGTGEDDDDDDDSDENGLEMSVSTAMTEIIFKRDREMPECMYRWLKNSGIGTSCRDRHVWLATFASVSTGTFTEIGRNFATPPTLYTERTLIDMFMECGASGVSLCLIIESCDLSRRAKNGATVVPARDYGPSDPFFDKTEGESAVDRTALNDAFVSLCSSFDPGSLVDVSVVETTEEAIKCRNGRDRTKTWMDVCVDDSGAFDMEFPRKSTDLRRHIGDGWFVALDRDLVNIQLAGPRGFKVPRHLPCQSMKTFFWTEPRVLDEALGAIYPLGDNEQVRRIACIHGCF